MTTCWELVRMLGGRQTSDRALQSSLSADTDLSQFLITLGNLAGVRIALYLQVYFNFILVRSSNIDYAAAAWAMTTTFWAFFAAAVDLWRRNELTMLQAIVTSFLLSLHAASGILCIVGTYSTQRPRRPPTLPAIVLSIILSNAGAGAFGIAVALEGKQMGPNLDCNRNMNITVGFHRALSGQGDGLKWTLFSINLVYISICLVIFIFQIAIWIYRKGWQHGKMTPDCLVWTHYHFKRNGRKPYDVPYLQGNEFLHYRIEWIALVLECLWYSVIVHVELILVNNDIRKTTFGFGQILALFTLAIPIEAIARWALEADADGQAAGIPSRVRFKRALKQIFLGLGGLYCRAPIYLAWKILEYLFHYAVYKMTGFSHPHPEALWRL